MTARATLADTQAPVHFACGECDMICTSTPEKRSEGHSSEFDCVDCGKTVLERTGFYGFWQWEPVGDEVLGSGC